MKTREDFTEDFERTMNWATSVANNHPRDGVAAMIQLLGKLHAHMLALYFTQPPPIAVGDRRCTQCGHFHNGPCSIEVKP